MTEVRRLENKDVEKVHQLGINEKYFSVDEDNKFWPIDTLERIARDGLSFVVEDRGSIVGFLIATYQPVTRKMCWENMYVHRKYWGKGLPEECFSKSLAVAKERGVLFCEALVKKDNFASKKLCERSGFKIAGEYNWMLKFLD